MTTKIKKKAPHLENITRRKFVMGLVPKDKENSKDKHHRHSKVLHLSSQQRGKPPAKQLQKNQNPIDSIISTIQGSLESFKGRKSDEIDVNEIRAKVRGALSGYET